MSTFFINDEKTQSKEKEAPKRKTWDQQIFDKFKIEARGEVEEYVNWLDRLSEDPTMDIPQEYIDPNGINMHALLKKYPLLGQEYEMLTGMSTDVMLKQIDEDGYVGHVYMKEGMKKIKYVQIYGHKDFVKK